VLYRPGLAAEAAGQKPAGRPRSRGALPLGVTVFAYPEKFVTKRNILHTITSAKTRATAMLRQHAHTAERYMKLGRDYHDS